MLLLYENISFVNAVYKTKKRIQPRDHLDWRLAFWPQNIMSLVYLVPKRTKAVNLVTFPMVYRIFCTQVSCMYVACPPSAMLLLAFFYIAVCCLICSCPIFRCPNFRLPFFGGYIDVAFLSYAAFFVAQFSVGLFSITFSLAVFTVRLQMQRTVLLSQFYPSVCLSDACVVTKINDTLWIFWYHTKRQSVWFSDTNIGWWAMLPYLSNIHRKWPTLFEKRRLRQISVHNVLAVRDSEKSSITTNIKLTTSFPTSYSWSAYVAPKSPKVWLKERFFRFFE